MQQPCNCEDDGEDCDIRYCERPTFCPSVHAFGSQLVYAAGGWYRDVWIKLDLAERRLIVVDVLLEDTHERFGLLGAEIDALEVAYFNFGLALLLQSAEDQEEVPDAYSYLNAVGVLLGVLRSVDHLDGRLRWH